MANCVLIGKPHNAVAGLLICQSHLDEIGKWLIDVETEADKLDARKSMAILWDDGHGGLAFEQAPVRLNAVVANDRRFVRAEDVDHPAGFDPEGVLSVFATLHRYAERVRAERMLSRPTIEWLDVVPHTDPPVEWHRSAPMRLTIRTETALLTRQLEDWIAFQPWVDEMYLELRTLREQLQRVNGNEDPKPLPGRCPRFDDASNPCLGRLWPVKPTHSSGTFISTETDSVYAVQCERDHRHRWEGRDLIRLSLILEEQK